MSFSNKNFFIACW